MVKSFLITSIPDVGTVVMLTQSLALLHYYEKFFMFIKLFFESVIGTNINSIKKTIKE